MVDPDGERPEESDSSPQEPSDEGAPARLPLWLIALLSISFLAFVAAMGAIHTVSGVDLWWQLKTGEIIRAFCAVPYADLYSHTAAGRPWVAQEWLTEVLFSFLYSLSPQWLVVWKTLMITFIFGTLLRACYRESGHLWASLGLSLLAAYAARPFFDIRPQLVSYLGTVVFLSFLLRPGGRHLWALPLTTLVWANLHAGFHLGLFLIASFAFWESAALLRKGRPRPGRLPSLWSVLGLSLLAGLANPNGYHLYLYPFRLMGHETVMGFVVEWFSPNFHESYARPFEAILILALVCLALSRRPKPPVALWLLACFLHAALMFFRNAPLFSLMAAVLIAPHLADVLERAALHSLRQPVRRYAIPLALLVASFLSGGAIGQAKTLFGQNWFETTIRRSAFPEAACRFIEARRLEGPMYNEYKWGGYLIWRFYPRRKVFMDGRAEVYFGPAFDAYYRIHNTHPGWQQALDRYGVRFALVDVKGGLYKALSASRNWRSAYQDTIAAVFVRREKAIVPKASAPAQS
ncbi:MAG: hypothetical protein IT210_22070 [Armatimonadetes bacterium]|nr:hypothetical protein [Armatimonadota bacterium]